ncbi:cytochrome P450 [Mariannaea sp. PMI_226]|nr:cytochrome P450 [Mariannaea sp. PMI_226]
MTLGQEKELELVGSPDVQSTFISHFLATFRPLLAGLSMTVFLPHFVVSPLSKKKQIARKLFRSMANMAGSEDRRDSLPTRGSSLANHFQDEAVTSDQIFNLFAAATQGTFGCMQIGLALLAQNQEDQDELRRTVCHTFSPDEGLTEQTLLQCQYLQWVINETLRLHPTLPLTTRIATRDCTLPGGGGPKNVQPISYGRGNEYSLKSEGNKTLLRVLEQKCFNRTSTPTSARLEIFWLTNQTLLGLNLSIPSWDEEW